MEMHSGSRDQRTASSVERCFFLHIHGGGSWRRGAVEVRRQMCCDGHAQEDDIVGVMVASMAERPDKVDA